MEAMPSYQKEVHNDVLHHRLIIVENLSPVLSPQEREMILSRMVDTFSSRIL